MERDSKASDRTPTRNRRASSGRSTGAEAKPDRAGDEEEIGPVGVQDAYVARRVAEHVTAMTEADRVYAAERAAAGAPTESPFVRDILIGLAVAVLLLAVILALTQASPPTRAPVAGEVRTERSMQESPRGR